MPFSTLLGAPFRSGPGRAVPPWRAIGAAVGLLLGCSVPGCQGVPAEAAAETQDPPPPAPAAELNTGVVIDLGSEDTPSHVVDGFSLPERVGSRVATWSEGELSTLAFNLRGGAQQYEIAFLAEPYHMLKDVSVGVALNKRPVADTILTSGWRAYGMVVKGEMLGAGRNEVSFHYSKTGRPSDFDPRSSDVRELGVRFDQVQIQPIGPSVQLSFGSRNALALAALGEGWARDPSDRGTGTWTLGARSTLTFHLAKSDAPVYRLSLDARAPRGVSERKVTLSLNGTPLGELAFRDKKQTLALDVPAEHLTGDDELSLDFGRIESPADLDPKSKDQRLLGLRIFDLDVAPK
jgi:hypothetical protein